MAAFEVDKDDIFCYETNGFSHGISFEWQGLRQIKRWSVLLLKQMTFST
jgi:hypothetical protein